MTRLSDFNLHLYILHTCCHIKHAIVRLYSYEVVVGCCCLFLMINVDLAIFQPYLDLEAGDNQSLKIQVARPGIEPRSSCSANQELNHSATAAPTLTRTALDWKKKNRKNSEYHVPGYICNGWLFGLHLYDPNEIKTFCVRAIFISSFCQIKVNI